MTSTPLTAVATITTTPISSGSPAVLAGPPVPPHANSALSRNEVLCLFPGLATWPKVRHSTRAGGIIGALRVLDWLHEFPGATWQQRWVAAGADHNGDWLDEVMADESQGIDTRRLWAGQGLYWILLSRAVQPGYAFFQTIRSQRLCDYARESLRPESRAGSHSPASGPAVVSTAR